MAVVSSVTKHFPTAQEGFSTTTSGSVSSGASSVGLASVSGYANGEVVALVIDPTDSDKKQVFTGTVDTAGTQITGVVWTEGTDQDHTTGATVVDYETATAWAMIAKGLLVDHSYAGAHEITANYDPSNPTLETQKWVGVASAVNEVTATNAVTGGNPSLTATGGDTNIHLLLQGKGTGSALLGKPLYQQAAVADNTSSATYEAFNTGITMSLPSGTWWVEVDYYGSLYNNTAAQTTTITVYKNAAAITSPYTVVETALKVPTGGGDAPFPASMHFVTSAVNGDVFQVYGKTTSGSFGGTFDTGSLIVKVTGKN